MAYTDDAVKAKLSALNETQEGIVTVAQWVMFHRRHAERTAQLWLQKLRDSPAPKRLNLIYLANEVAQQSRARRKEDFLIAFSPIIAEAVAAAYKGSSNDIQQKIRRVVEVWRQRGIFEPPIQEAVEARVDDLDKSRSTGKKPPLGGSLFSSPSTGSTPSEIQPLVPLQVAVSKAAMTSGASSTAANAEYEKMKDPNTPLPTPPVHAARLSQLLKTLANAESSVSEVINSRLALIEGLEKIIQTNRRALSKEHLLATQLKERMGETETKKREVEDGIMRGLAAQHPPAVPGDDGAATDNLPRPEVEALTPPPVEALTPVGSPKPEAQEAPEPGPFSGGFTQPGFEHPTAQEVTLPHNLQESLNGLQAKKRKVDHTEEDYAQFAGGDLDADVAELLKQEGDAQ